MNADKVSLLSEGRHGGQDERKSHLRGAEGDQGAHRRQDPESVQAGQGQAVRHVHARQRQAQTPTAQSRLCNAQRAANAAQHKTQ